MKVTILNTSILTNYGEYSYQKISVTKAQATIANGFESYVGHQSTCDLLTKILGVEVPMNRTLYKQEPDDIALVFKLNGRPEEGKILTVDEIEAIGYEFGQLQRTQ